MLMSMKGHNGFRPCCMCNITGIAAPDGKTLYVPLDRSHHPRILADSDAIKNMTLLIYLCAHMLKLLLRLVRFSLQVLRQWQLGYQLNMASKAPQYYTHLLHFPFRSVSPMTSCISSSKMSFPT